MDIIKITEKAEKFFTRSLHFLGSITIFMLICMAYMTSPYSNSWLHTNLFVFFLGVLPFPLLTTVFLSSYGFTVNRYVNEVKNQKFNAAFYKKRLQETEVLLNLSNEQLTKRVIDVRLNVNLNLSEDGFSFKGMEIIIPIQLVRKKLEEKLNKLKREMQENFQEIKEPKFVAFWRKHILPLRFPKLHIASV